MFGLTPTGFTIKTRDQIFSDLSDLAKSPEAFGADVDLTPYSPLGIFLGLVAESNSLLWQYFEAIYYGAFLDTAEGVDLDRLARFAGVTRKQPQKEQVQLLFTGVNSTVIPVDYIIQTPSGIQFKTTEFKFISGETSVAAEAINFGVVSRVGINQLTEFATPVSGIDSVVNPTPSSGGSELESDADLRARAIDNINIFRRNTGIVEYIKRQIKNDPNVISCEIIENNLNVEANGMEPHSMQFIIDGGSDLYIATLIRKFKPAGIKLIGNILTNVDNGAVANGGTDPIYFSRPGDYTVVVKLDLTTNTEWDNANLRKIKSAIVQYIGGIDSYTESGNDFVNEYKGLGVGKKVSVFNIYPIVAAFAGVENLNLLLGTTPYNTVSNIITPPSGMRAKIVTADIIVSVT